MRRVLNKTKSGAKVADALKELEVEGGLAGKWRVLYEVSQLHKQTHQFSDVLPCMNWLHQSNCDSILYCIPCKALLSIVATPGQANVRPQVALLRRI